MPTEISYTGSTGEENQVLFCRGKDSLASLRHIEKTGERVANSAQVLALLYKGISALETYQVQTLSPPQITLTTCDALVIKREGQERYKLYLQLESQLLLDRLKRVSPTSWKQGAPLSPGDFESFTASSFELNSDGPFFLPPLLNLLTRNLSLEPLPNLISAICKYRQKQGFSAQMLSLLPPTDTCIEEEAPLLFPISLLFTRRSFTFFGGTGQNFSNLVYAPTLYMPHSLTFVGVNPHETAQTLLQARFSEPKQGVKTLEEYLGVEPSGERGKPPVLYSS